MDNDWRLEEGGICCNLDGTYSIYCNGKWKPVGYEEVIRNLSKSGWYDYITRPFSVLGEE